MVRIALALLIGAVIGSIATYQMQPAPPRSVFPEPTERDIVQVSEISVAEAQVHRQERFASIKTIEDTLALPTDFAETEALYVIAGRSDSSELQDLIYQASRIRDRQDRSAALGILLSRLTELDPYSALAIARDPVLQNSSNLENVVWTTWGRLNLDIALQAAQTGSPAQKSYAAQALYATVRDFDSEKVQLINSALRVKPGRNVLAQQIYSIAAQSPADAIRFIESQGTQSEQQEQMSWLAQFLSRSSHGGQADFIELIQSPANRMMFERSIVMYRTTADPEEALEKYLAEPTNQNNRSQMQIALQALARQDPKKALAWARANDKSTDQSALVSVIGQIAQHDPQLAMSEAQSIQNMQARQQAIGMALVYAAQNNPAEAAEMLNLVADSSMRQSLLVQLGQQWVASDYEAAVQWVASLSAEEQRFALQSMGHHLANSNVDSAIALLDQFPNSGPRNLKVQIVQSLAQNRSIDAALAFVSKYKGTEEYPRLQVAVISNLAASDADRAMQMAGSLQDERLRDQLYATVVSRKAAEDPRLALQWLDSISNSAQRQQAMSQIVMVWHSTNPDDARTWVNSLPQGTSRDDAVVAMLAIRREPGPEAQQLIETIGDASKRKQAALGLVGRLMHSDPDEAERLLLGLDLTDTERLQYQQMLERTQYNGYVIDY